MEKIKNFFINFYPVFVLLIVVSVLAVTNYHPGTFLTGWDNLHPEFNFELNIKRSLFAVWQEYQGLGLLGGMGHAADLIRQIFLLLASIFIPDNFIRYFWAFTTLFLGSTGAYFLINYVLKKLNRENKLIALTGAFFYLLNISTIQVFFIPFEAFIAHYAFLPWIILTTIIFLEKPNKKNALITFIVFLLTSPQAYIPTLFVSTMLAIGIISLPFFYKDFKRTFKAFGLLILLIFLANSFWLLPFLFFTLTQSSVNVNSKINQMATQVIFLQNKEYGDLINVPLLKGYLFSNVEPDRAGNFNYILGVWRNYFNNILVLISSYFIFGVIIFGLFKAFILKNKLSISFALFFIFGFAMLATDIPPFSFINAILRDHIPLFGQAFRFPYTKFLTVASLSYAVLLALGISGIIEMLKNKIAKILTPVIFIFLITALALPAFFGNLFYYKERLNIPKEYFQTFDYFKNSSQNNRIANFPQYTYWGWNFYKWDYSGSGFLWYGIDQPILDRAFDVWSQEDENYYWELNQALYSKNPNQFEQVLNKYDIKTLLVDKNVINPVSPKSLFINELKEMIDQIPAISKTNEFGNIEIYSVNLKNNPDNFVSSLNRLSSSNGYNWSEFDQAYAQIGNYYSDSNTTSSYFPFRTLFSNKSQNEKSFNISQDNKFIEFSSPLPEYANDVKLHLPSSVTANNTIPIYLIAKKSGNQTSIYLKVVNPQIILRTGNQDKILWENTVEKELFKTNANLNPLSININGVSNYKIGSLKENEETIIGTTSLSVEQDNSIVLNSNNKTLDSAIVNGLDIKIWFVQDDSYLSLPGIEKDSYLVLKTPRLNDQYSSQIIDPVDQINKKLTEVNNCDNFRKEYFSYFIKEEQEKKLLELSSENATPCIAFYTPSLDHDQSYLVGITNRNINDQSLHFWVLNEDQKQPIIDKYLDKNENENTSFTVIPPMEKFGKSYSFHFDNMSIGPSKSGNLLGKITIDPIPYYFITNLRIEDPNNPPISINRINLSTSHPNQSLYLIKLGQTNKDSAISLSQSYSPYWKAYEVNGFGILQRSFPFIFGKSVGQTLKIDNWKNGWIIKSGTKPQLIIVYIPQYLEYIGFALTSGTLLLLSIAYFKDRKKHDHEN